MPPAALFSATPPLHLDPLRSRAAEDSVQVPAVILIGLSALGVTGAVASSCIFAWMYRRQRESRPSSASHDHTCSHSHGESTDVQTSLGSASLGSASLGSASLEEGGRHDAGRGESREDWVMELRQYAPHRRGASDNTPKETGGSASGKGRVVIEMSGARDGGLSLENRAEPNTESQPAVKNE